MATSDFWRDLADKFRVVTDKFGYLGADWSVTTTPGEQSSFPQWDLKDGGSPSTRVEFEAVARRAGIAIDPSVDSLAAWLEALKNQMPTVVASRHAVHRRADGSVATFTVGGSITNVCRESADFCRLLEAKAIEAERLATAPESIDPKTEALLAHAKALYWQGIQELKTEKQDRLDALMSQNISSLGRAIHRERIVLEILTKQIKIRIGTYGEVAREHSAPEMLKESLLATLREETKRSAHFAMLALVGLNEGDGHAAGDYDTVAYEASRKRLERSFEPKILDVVNAELGVLETSPLTLPRNRTVIQPTQSGAYPLVETEAAIAHARSLAASMEPEQSSTPSPLAGNADDREAIRGERTALLLAYKRECKERGITVTDSMIATAASTRWNHRTPVARWKAADSRCTPADDKMIRDVLKQKPHLK